MTKFTNEQVEHMNKVQTFITAIGERGSYADENFDYNVYYVGADMDMAENSFRLHTDWDRAIIYVYVNGVRAKKLKRRTGGSWEVVEDRAAELTAEIDQLQAQLFDKSSQLQKILGNV